MSPKGGPKDADGQSYEDLLSSTVEALAELGATVQEAERMGVGPLGLQAARSEVKAVRNELANQMGALMRIAGPNAPIGELDEGLLGRTTDTLREVADRLRRLVAPTNAHHLANMSLAAMPLFLEHLPGILLALSRIPEIDADLAGRLFILSGEFEFYAVLLSSAIEPDEPESNLDETAAAVDRLRNELNNLATTGAHTDVALLRKRLNDALDDIEGEDAAVEEVLVRIGETSDQIEAYRENLDHLVAAARERGASWNKIARAVGISVQSAHKRWDPEARAKARVYMQEYAGKRRDGSAPRDEPAVQ